MKRQRVPNHLMGVFVLGADAIPVDQNAVYSDSGTILAVQQQLLARGITDEKGNPIKPDGIQGTHTTAAIKKIQAALGQPQTGTIDSVVLMALKVTPSASPSSWTPQSSPPSDGRPAKGWSQPQPDKMGPAITPDSGQGGFSAILDKIKSANIAGVEVWKIALGGLGAALLGVGVYGLATRRG